MDTTPNLFPDLPMTTAPAPAALVASGAEMSEISPGVWITAMPEWQIPSHVISRVAPIPHEPGKFHLIPEEPLGYIRMTEDIGQRLNIHGLSETTLRRLMWAGLIDHFLGAPGCTYISIESLLSHIRATRNDHASQISFWTPQRRADWKATCAGGAASR